MKTGFLQWYPVTGSEAVGTDRTQEVLSEHQETLFHCEGDRAQAQVAQRSHGVSILGDNQKPAGQGPGQPVLGDGPA